MNRPIRLMHMISGLQVGGAEWSLHQLLTVTDRSEFHPVVVSLTTEGPLAKRIRDLDVEVRAPGLSRARPSPLSLLSIAREIRRFRPDVVQTWMYHADLMGGLAVKLAGGPPVAWRTCHMDLDLGSTQARAALKAGWNPMAELADRVAAVTTAPKLLGETRLTTDRESSGGRPFWSGSVSFASTPGGNSVIAVSSSVA